MKILLLIPLLLVGGCVGLVREAKKPPFPYAVTHSSRITGFKATYQGQGLFFGWMSENDTFVPCSTNELFAATISQTFRLGETGNPFNVTITEDVQTGWKGTPPTPRLIFSPKDKSTK